MRIKYEDLMLKKHMYGQLKNSNSKWLSDWIDGKVLSELKFKIDDVKNEIS